MATTEADVVEALRPVEDPELHRSIVDLGMVKGVAIDGGVAAVRIALTVAGCPLRNEIQNRVSTAVVALDGIDRVDLDFTVMTDEERADVREMLHGDPASHRRHPSGPRPRRGPGDPLRRPVEHAPACCSSPRARAAWASRRSPPTSPSPSPSGATRSPSSTPTCGASRSRGCSASSTPPVVIDQMLVPPESYGVRCISMGFFVEEEQPVIWRGPMLHKALEQFLTDVFWDEPDFLLVDLPPGTGDIALSLAQFLPRAELYVVTTPAAGRPAGGPARRLHGREGQPRGQGRDREHVVVHRRRRHSATRSSARAAAPSWPSASRSRSLGQVPLMIPHARGLATPVARSWPSTRRARPRWPSRRSPRSSTSSWRPPAATTPASSSSADPPPPRSGGRPASPATACELQLRTGLGAGTGGGRT